MRIRRPSRFRRVAKWVGLGVCLAILVAWGLAIRDVLTLPGPHSFSPRLSGGDPGTVFLLCALMSLVYIYLLILFAIPTAILWRRDRRPPKGHCQHCGYKLTGNETRVCPECATAVSSGVIAK